MQRPTQQMKTDIAKMEKRQQELLEQLAAMGSKTKFKDSDRAGGETHSAADKPQIARAMTAKATTQRECAGEDDSSTGHAGRVSPRPGEKSQRGDAARKCNRQQGDAVDETIDTDTRAMIAKATRRRACAGADKSKQCQGDSKPSEYSQRGEADNPRKCKSTVVQRAKAVRNERPRSAIQGMPATVLDKLHVKPPTIDSIPKRKQQDPVEMAVIQVMQEHSLTVVPTQKSYRSMFDELVEIKAKKLIKSRIQRVKRRENRQKH